MYSLQHMALKIISETRRAPLSKPHWVAAVILVRLFGSLSHWSRTVSSAVLAVLGVNAVLAMFVFAAFGEGPDTAAKKLD